MLEAPLNNEEIEPIDLKKEKEDAFREYVENLNLSPEDFSKKILDVGSNAGEFAQWAKEHHVSDTIVSIDPQVVVKESPLGVRGVAEALPFADDSFELVLANASIPNMYYMEDSKELEIKVRESFNEMLRVVHAGGEVRVGPVWRMAALPTEEYPKMPELRDAVDVVLDELRARGVSVELKNEKQWTDQTPDGKERKYATALIILKKPKNT